MSSDLQPEQFNSLEEEELFKYLFRNLHGNNLHSYGLVEQ